MNQRFLDRYSVSMDVIDGMKEATQIIQSIFQSWLSRELDSGWIAGSEESYS